MSANWVELRPLRYFVMAADESNLTRASELLHVSQPAMSRQLSTLEENLGAKLFDRMPRGMRLTPAGERLLPHARAILAQIDTMVDDMDRMARGKLGAIRIGLSPVAMDLPRTRQVLDAQMRTDSNVDLILEVNPSSLQIARLCNGEQDVGFLFSEEPHNPHVNLALVEQHQLGVGLSTRHPLNALASLTFDDLRPYDFVGRFTSSALDRTLREWNFRPRAVQQITDTKLMLQVIASGHGLAFINTAWAQGPVEGVTVRRVDGLDVPLPIYMAWRCEETQPVILNFVERALGVIGTGPAG
ncbi:MAG: transcriptional regulator, LysR family [Phenylobacterium sp.]|nr:transcriptional regulator, LysR family [Phenylobacterium sp.]